MITPYGSYGLDDSLKPAGNEYGATRECVVNSTGKYAVTNGVYERGAGFAEAAARGDLAGAGAGIVLCEGRQELCCLPGSPLHIGCAKRLPWSTHEAAVSAV